MPFYILIRDFGFLGVAIVLAMAAIGSSEGDKTLCFAGAGIFAALWAVVVFGML